MDWFTVAALAAITWSDGLRRVGQETILLQQLTTGRWRLVAYPSRSRKLTLVSWWAPFLIPLVLSTTALSGAKATELYSSVQLARCKRRLRRAAPTLRILKALGIFVTLGVIVGIPSATARFGVFGLVSSLTGVIALSVVISALSYRILRRVGLSSKSAVRKAASLLSPFGAPRASEIVLVQATAGTSALLVARELLPSEAFNRWIRPWAYDAIYRRDGVTFSFPQSELMGTWRIEDLRTLIDTPPADSSRGELYCPRCGGLYITSAEYCPDCGKTISGLLRIA